MGNNIRSSSRPKALAPSIPMPPLADAMDAVHLSVDRFCLLAGVEAEPVGIVHVVVPAKAPENGLAELRDKTVATVLPTTGVGEYVPGNLAQSDRIIQFPVRQQPGVGSDLGTVELKLEPAVKVQPQNPLFRSTHRVSHINTPNTPIT